MREFLEIMLCTFATYGFCRFIHMIKVLCSRRVRVVVALRADGDTDKRNFCKIFGCAASVALNMDNAESEPVILCDDEEVAKGFGDEGYSVYLLYSEEKDD